MASNAVAILRDRSESLERRVEAAAALRRFKSRDTVQPLIEVLAEGHQELSWTCMSALTHIGSRRHARRLMQIASAKYPLPARQEAIYALWRLGETRSESLFIRLSGAVDTEEEYTRDMATEALGNTRSRPRTQRALAERLFDPSVSVRYAALCAVGYVDFQIIPRLQEALTAKLADPSKMDGHRAVAEQAAYLLSTLSLRIR